MIIETAAAARTASLLDQAHLCYVQGDWAFFTTQSLTEQTGDDWDDAPYEHNAGRPYKYDDFEEKRGKKPWTIIQVAFECPMETPNWGFGLNSPWTVEQINSGDIPWLRRWAGMGEDICAGATLREFIAVVQRSGGNVWMPIS